MTLNNRNKNELIGLDSNIYLKTTKDLIKSVNTEKKDKKLSNKVIRMKSSKINKLKEIKNKEKEGKEINILKSKIKFKNFLILTIPLNINYITIKTIFNFFLINKKIWVK